MVKKYNKRNKKAPKSVLSQADIKMGEQRIYFLLGMIVISLLIALYVMN